MTHLDSQIWSTVNKVKKYEGVLLPLTDCGSRQFHSLTITKDAHTNEPGTESMMNFLWREANLQFESLLILTSSSYYIVSKVRLGN